MTADPFVTIVFFAAVLLVVCGVYALVEDAITRNERRRSREWKRRMMRHHP